MLTHLRLTVHSSHYVCPAPLLLVNTYVCLRFHLIALLQSFESNSLTFDNNINAWFEVLGRITHQLTNYELCRQMAHHNNGVHEISYVRGDLVMGGTLVDLNLQSDTFEHNKYVVNDLLQMNNR